MESKPMKVVYVITERGEKSYWTRIGVAYTNRDGSLNIKLDAVPVSGTMQVRDWTPRDEQPAANGAHKGNGAALPPQPLDDFPSPF